MGEQGQKPTPENATLFQGFEWNVPADQKHWKRLLSALPTYADLGITALWLPPGCKASSNQGNGYDIYDLYDLGEFDQKGGVATKWGTFDELKELCSKAKEVGIGIYWDAVLNHKAGADKIETIKVVDVDTNDRTKEISEPHDIDAWVEFDFPGRGNKYSEQKWHWYHFTGTDFDNKTGAKGIFKILGENKGWAESVDKEQGNADYMMFADIDYHHDDIIADVKNWGVWITKTLGLKGFRLDAVQHFSERFTNEWVAYVRKECGAGQEGNELGLGEHEPFMVGEFWVGDREVMCKWLEQMEHNFCLYDAPLLYNFASMGKQEKADLRKVFDKSLVQVRPVNAVTVVQNHDTQPGQTVATPIEGFFKPLAYTLILLRQEGYPCPFYGDLYGTKGEHAEDPSCGGKLADMILARKLFAYGEQDDYHDQPNCIGWVRRGTHDKPEGCAVVMSNADAGEIRMFVGEERKGQTWSDLLGWEEKEVKIGDDGFGVFPCPGVSVSIFTNKEAQGREKFPVEFDANIYG